MVTKKEKEAAAKALEAEIKDAENKNSTASESVDDIQAQADKIIADAEKKAAELEEKATKAAEKIITDAKKSEKALDKKLKALDKKMGEAVESEDEEVINMIPDDWEDQPMVKIMNNSATTYNLPQLKKVRGKTVKIWPEQIVIPGSQDGNPAFTEIPKFMFDEMTNKDINKARILTKEQAAQRNKLLDERKAVQHQINSAKNEDKSKLYRTTRPTSKELFLIRNPMPQEV